MTTLASRQRRAEREMRDTVAFGSMTKTTNADGFQVDTFTATFSGIPGKVSDNSLSGNQGVRMVTVGGTERPVISGGIHIPAGRTEAITTGMIVKVTALGPESPAHMLNRLYRIEGESTKSHQTARRFDVVQL